MIRQRVRHMLMTALILIGAVSVVYVVTHTTIDTYSGANGQRGVVIGWQGPGPVQCFGAEYGSHPGPFMNVDC